MKRESARTRLDERRSDVGPRGEVPLSETRERIVSAAFVGENKRVDDLKRSVGLSP